jgi:hypothetical protein
VHDSWPEAWLLLAHPSHGRLVDLLSGSVEALPSTPQTLPSAEAAAAAEPCTEHTRMLRRRMKVVHSPHVLVRTSPSLTARASGYRACGALLLCDAQRGDWLRLAAPEQPAGAPSEPAAAGASAEQWVLAVHPELGPLLQNVSAS